MAETETADMVRKEPEGILQKERNRLECARSHIQTLSLMSILTALGVALGFALAAIPNVELVTSTIFLSGMILGKARGTAVGVLTEGLYSILSPYGTAPLPMLAAQCTAMGIAGFAGGLLGSFLARPKGFRFILLGLCGFACTLIFAWLTTAAYMAMSGSGAAGLAAGLVQGFGFYAAHLVSNTLFFMILIPVVLQGLSAVGLFGRMHHPLGRE